MTGTCIEARGLRKSFGAKVALGGVDLRVAEGSVVGIIGRNGAGKTTLLNTILGLTDFEGELRVLGRDPWRERAALMHDVAFLTDVAVLPRWIRVSQLLDYVAGVQPRFDRARAESFLSETTIPARSKVKELSKGMVTQLHLALVMGVDAQLLVLDEPTLGLDLMYVRKFYDTLLGEYLDGRRTAVIATHAVEEVQNVLTDLVFMEGGRISRQLSMEELETRYVELRVRPEHLARARSLVPIHERSSIGESILLFEGADPGQLETLGEVGTPRVSTLFAAFSEAR